MIKVIYFVFWICSDMTAFHYILHIKHSFTFSKLLKIFWFDLFISIFLLITWLMIYFCFLYHVDSLFIHHVLKNFKLKSYYFHEIVIEKETIKKKRINEYYLSCNWEFYYWHCLSEYQRRIINWKIIDIQTLSILISEILLIMIIKWLSLIILIN
jgi:hypothetical protein